MKQDILAGQLRGQIIAALAAITSCTLSLTNNVLNAAPGSSSSAPTCPSGTTANAQGVCVANTGIDFTKIALYGGLGVAGLIIVLLVVKR
ncbi:MAG: hypothetical protein IVW54_16950 [Candidatus Binataceae bacterium]|nr:hypothetical protein [Candidatus Binataceae bacterium]